MIMNPVRACVIFAFALSAAFGSPIDVIYPNPPNTIIRSKIKPAIKKRIGIIALMISPIDPLEKLNVASSLVLV